MKRLFALFLAAMMAFCGAAGAEYDEEKRVIVVGVSAGHAPFEFCGEDGYVIGFDADLMQLITMVLDYGMELVEMEAEALFPALEAGEIELAISSLTAWEEAAGELLFSQPYYDASLRIVVPAQSTVTGSVDLAGKKTGVLGEADARLKDAEIVSYEALSAALSALAGGELEAVVISAEAARIGAEALEGWKVLEEDGEAYVIYAAPGREALLEEVNVALETLRGLGYFDALHVFWFDDAE